MGFAIKGKDRDRNIVGLWVRLLDAAGQTVVGFDTNRDGVADSFEGPVALESPKWVGEAVTGTAMLRGFFAGGRGAVTQVGVVLQDATNLRSEEQLVGVTDQPVTALGQACDPLFLADRCSSGLGCRGTPATCQEGLAPEITRLGFFRAAGGPNILVEGTDPEDDLASVRFEFQSASGAAISIDSDGDGTPDMSSFDFSAVGAAVDGAFFFRMKSRDGLDTQVPKLVATASDQAGHTGSAKSAAPSNPPTRAAGQTCDIRGFDVCAVNLACSPGFAGETNKCETAATLRAAQCAAAAVLEPSSTGAIALGVASGVSLWDTPTGCSSNDPTGRPEGIVTLRLAQRASKVTLTTALPGTTFDTALYVFPGCPNDNLSLMDCNDDAPGASGASAVVLTDLPAGDYLIVVDSFDFNGGSFELKATVE